MSKASLQSTTDKTNPNSVNKALNANQEQQLTSIRHQTHLAKYSGQIKNRCT